MEEELDFVGGALAAVEPLLDGILVNLGLATVLSLERTPERKVRVRGSKRTPRLNNPVECTPYC